MTGLKTPLRCGQQHDRFICLVLRALQCASAAVALGLVGGGFKGTKVTVTDARGASQELTVYYGGPMVNFAVVVTFSAWLYTAWWLLLVFVLRRASAPAPWLFGIDACFTMLFMSAGCGLAASDYVRYCDVLTDRVHCTLVTSGAALCFMAFVGFLLSVAWGAWMRNTWIKQAVQKTPLGSTDLGAGLGDVAHGRDRGPVLGDGLDIDVDRTSTSYGSSSYAVQDGYARA